MLSSLYLVTEYHSKYDMKFVQKAYKRAISADEKWNGEMMENPQNLVFSLDYLHDIIMHSLFQQYFIF